VAAPFVAFATLAVLSAVVGLALFLNTGFLADIIVIMYLLMVNSIMIILGGSATGNVYSSLGAGREIKLLLADELAFILVVMIPVVKSGYNLQLTQIIEYQSAHGAFVGSLSGAIAFIIGIICIQAKMTLPPFHIPEAETEIVEGPFMEYSGPPLAFWKLNHLMMYVVMPFLLITLFLGGFNLTGIGILWAVLKYLAIVVLMIIIKNTNPRIRIDTALHFFWKYAAPITFIALILAVLGV
jgi:NADH-quinone oxidoreductase subunit H